MVVFTVDEIRDLMGKATNIRNMSIVECHDHGVAKLKDILKVSDAKIQSAGYSDPTYLGGPDHHDTEGNFPVTTKTANTPLYFEVTEETLTLTKQQSTGPAFLINMIEPPRYLDISAEVAATFCVADGALIVINCVEPIPLHIKNVLRQAVDERVKPLLVLNLIEPIIQGSKMTPEELYQSFVRTIDSVNSVVAAAAASQVKEDTFKSNLLFHPNQSTVAFASGLNDWAFTIDGFAQRYAKKFGLNREILALKFWGDNYFNMEKRKWTTENTDAQGQPLQRSFVMFILDPIYRLMDAILNFKTETWQTMLQKLEINLTRAENELNGKALLKVVMKKFLPAKDALLEMTVLHLPSPVTAQKYRVETLYEGPMNDECATGIRNCDPEGPLMMFVSKMVRTTDKGRFFGFGRVFSGSIRAGVKVRIMGPTHTVGTKSDLFLQSIQRLVLLSKGNSPVVDCPAGNVVGVVGIDQFLLRTGTISSSDCAYHIRNVRFSDVPVVEMVVRTKDPKDLPKLVESLKNITRVDSSFKSTVSFIGEHVLLGSEVRALDRYLEYLEKDLGEVLIEKSKAFVQYRETVQAESSVVALSKTPNRHSRFFMKACPLDEELTRAIEERKIDSREEVKRTLREDYGWSETDAHNIWAFGPESAGPNILVNCTKGVSYLSEIKEAFSVGFQWAMHTGLFADEPIRGCRFNILDVVMISDAIHRGSGQIIPGSRSVVYASMLLAQPGFMEPFYLMDLICPQRVIPDVLAVLKRHRGAILGEDQQLQSSSDSILMVKAQLPVEESFTFSAELSEATGGLAVVCQMTFDHWELMPGILNEDPKLIELVQKIRMRKGLEAKIPTLENYMDRL